MAEQRKPGGQGGRRSNAAEEDDRFEERLKPYGLTAKDVLPGDLVVPPGKLLHISSERGQVEERGFVSLRPRTIDDVKRWLGAPDEVARQKPCAPECPPAVSIVAGPSELRNLTQPQLRGLYQLGETYVHGDSSTLAAYKETLDHLVVDAVIVGVFIRQDIDVHGVLEIGADVKLLWARRVRIWPRGVIRLLGNGKIDCLSIEGVQIVKIPPGIEAYAPPIGRLTALEVEHA